MEIILISLLTVFASTIGTVTGFGTSTIMIPILVIFFSPVEAIFLVSIIHWFGNIWKVSLFRSGFNLRLLVLFGVVGLATSYLGAFIALGANQQILLRLLGGFFMGYALFLIFQSKFKVSANSISAIFGGALSGFFAGMFGTGGAIRSVFLLAFKLPKVVYIATAGAIGIMVDSTRIIKYFTGGAILPKELWLGMFLFIPASFMGAQIAKKIVDKTTQDKFRILVAFFLFAIGLKLILSP